MRADALKGHLWAHKKLQGSSITNPAEGKKRTCDATSINQALLKQILQHCRYASNLQLTR